jgi:plastocyanin
MRCRRMMVLFGLVLGNMTLAAGPAHAGGACADGPFKDQRTTEIKVTPDCFLPTVARVDVGDTVTFFNGADVMHTVGGVAGSFGSLHKELAPEKKVSYRFDEEGVFPYLCLVHPGMAGAIVVGDGEGEVTSGGITQVSPPVSGGAAAADAAPRNRDSDRSWLLPGAIAIALAFLASVGLFLRRRQASAAM